MAERTHHEALVGAKFAQDSGYTAPAVGDKVAISGDYEVAAAAADDVVLGEVFALNLASGNVNASVTVEMRGAKVDRVVASGSITAGDYVKAAGSNAFVTFTPAAGTSSLIYGIALEGANDAESLDVLVR